MKPEKLTQELEKACPSSLKSVILYGSAAAGDHIGKQSDYNVLVVLDDLDIRTLNALSKPASAWSRAGNPAPLLFTEQRLAQAADVFPIELLDIAECRKVLFGADAIEGLEISKENLRLQIEHELRGALIQLRQRYLLTGGKQKAVVDLMAESLSTFLVLFRAALRLFEEPVPQKKLEALGMLAGHLGFDVAVFETVQGLKERTEKAKDQDAEALFSRYLKTVECVIDAVDAAIQQEKEI